MSQKWILFIKKRNLYTTLYNILNPTQMQHIIETGYCDRSGIVNVKIGTHEEIMKDLDIEEPERFDSVEELCASFEGWHYVGTVPENIPPENRYLLIFDTDSYPPEEKHIVPVVDPRQHLLNLFKEREDEDEEKPMTIEVIPTEGSTIINGRNLFYANGDVCGTRITWMTGKKSDVTFVRGENYYNDVWIYKL